MWVSSWLPPRFPPKWFPYATKEIRTEILALSKSTAGTAGMELLKRFEMLGKHPRSSCHPSEQSNRALSPKCNAAVYQGEGISVCRGHFGSSLVLPVTSLEVHVAGIHLFSHLITIAYKPTFKLHCIKCSTSLNPSFPHFLFFMEFR